MSKCEFGKPELNFLGFRISKDGIRTSEEHVKVITQFSRPKTVDELRRFLEIINFYRRHLPKTAEIHTK